MLKTNNQTDLDIKLRADDATVGAEPLDECLPVLLHTNIKHDPYANP